jgi:16S rRNA (cytosine967-C5)-methyltransferase
VNETAHTSGVSDPPDARRVAIDALVDIERRNSYANLALGRVLDASGLSERDRHFVTELVYGATRQRRTLDAWFRPFLRSDPPAVALAALRIGTYQLRVLGTPGHAAVHATVSAVPKALRGLVNVVLRKVSTADEPRWVSVGEELSYPDWLVRVLETDLGETAARGALEAMNEARGSDLRADGYVQNRASQWVVDLVDQQPGDVIADLCAAPGGKATALAGRGARVVALDRHQRRIQLVADNARRVGVRLQPVQADSTHPPLRPGAFDRVLLDAPCTGLGVLHRRPDARWQLTPESPRRLADEQAELLAAAAHLVRPGGVLVYSVCTLTKAETSAVWDAFERVADVTRLPRPDGPWREWGSGALLLPQDAESDGMGLCRWQVGSSS